MTDTGAVEWLREQVQAELAYRRKASEARRYYAFIEQAGGVQTALELDRAEAAVAQCEAELAILDAHDRPEHYCPLPVLASAHGQLWTPAEGPCWTIRSLASGYRHHTGYTEHWGNR